MIAAPGPEAALAVSSVPPGWTLVYEESPEAARGNRVIFQVFEGPEIDTPDPGGSHWRQEVFVNAAHVPGVSGTAASQDLASLATSVDPFEWRTEATFEVNGREAVMLSHPVGPTTQKEIFMLIGDWRVSVLGTGVDEETLQSFAEGVRLG